MTPFVLTPRAQADIIEICTYIRGENQKAAEEVKSAILAACSLVAAYPFSGHKRESLTRLPVRFWTLTQCPNYGIVYIPDSSPIRIIAVLHGKRNISRILHDR